MSGQFIPQKNLSQYAPLRAAKRKQGWQKRPDTCGSGCRYFRKPDGTGPKRGKCLLGGFLTNQRSTCEKWNDAPFMELGQETA